ncbi:MAG: flagellar biosynthetic protein FliO [Treponemataceae bacterium]|nr:flagellar biosynthetic protein FliO [Treponemataceae bacterium]
MKKIVLVGFLVVLLSAGGYAQTVTTGNAPGETQNQRVDERTLTIEEPSPAPSAVQNPFSFWTVFRLVLILGVVAAAVYGVVYFFRRLSRPTHQETSTLRLVASVHLGSNRFVHIIAVGRKAYLVGASDGGVHPIADIEDQETLDALFLEESEQQSRRSQRALDFKKFLASWGYGKEHGGKARKESFEAEEIRKQRERLKRLQS